MTTTWKSLPTGSIVVPCGLYLGSHKVIPKRNYYMEPLGKYGQPMLNTAVAGHTPTEEEELV